MQRPSHSRPFFGLLLYFSLIALVWAGVTYADFLHDLAFRESSLNATKVNKFGYAGLFQMGEAAMVDAGYYKSDGTAVSDWRGKFTGKNGINSLADFTNNPDAQVKAIADYQAVQWKVIQNLGLTKYLGQTINGVEITQSGLLAGAHLVGYGGLQKYLTSNGMNDVKDGNGTPISQYIQKFGGYRVGGPAPSYAAVAGAAGGSGMPVGSATVTTPGTSSGSVSTAPTYSLPAAPSMDALPSEAFYNNTGYQMGDVSDLITKILAASLFLWLVWMMLGTWKSFNDGRLALAQFKTDIIRALIILMLGIALIQ